MAVESASRPWEMDAPKDAVAESMSGVNYGYEWEKPGAWGREHNIPAEVMAQIEVSAPFFVTSKMAKKAITMAIGHQPQMRPLDLESATTTS
ncbi:MAG TPA: hypothetical protein VLA77_04285 [Candidatus Saccharimonadales bacterium]|nr:hypothetical protein [Candidatus Saccharimonadales bacterium]